MRCRAERILYHREVELVRWVRSVVDSGDLGLVFPGHAAMVAAA
jgi:hypothetical protein